MASNVVAHLDNKDNIYPRKELFENKIDGIVATIMALGRAIVFDKEAGVSIYEDEEDRPGLISF
jgi:phage terminase large subunit-like protein